MNQLVFSISQTKKQSTFQEHLHVLGGVWQQKTSSGTCYYCGSKVGYANLTMDHVIPLARGGRSTKDNLVPSCKQCNTKKKGSLPVEWEEYLRSLDDPAR